MVLTPQWARELLLDACLFLGIEEPPALVWRRASYGNYTGGHAKLETRQIVLTVGNDRLDQKRALLHELAHIAVNGYHTPEMWDTAWRLYRWAKLPLLAMRKREGAYRKGALVGYARSVRGKGRPLDSGRWNQRPGAGRLA